MNKIKQKTKINIEINCFIPKDDLNRIVVAIVKGLECHFTSELIKVTSQQKSNNGDKIQ